MINKKIITELACLGVEILYKEDPLLFELLYKEYEQQNNVLSIIASASTANPSVLACEGMVTTNVTTEGYPGARYHAGAQFIDEIERLAIDRAKVAFRAQYANVQPHSGSSANEIIIFSLLKPGDLIMGMELSAGGHLTHGNKVSVTGDYFNTISYGLDDNGYIDYEQARLLAKKYRPKLIICGASAYPRIIDFKKFREIADGIGAYLLADISHIAGLVISGLHPSPIDYAHFTTTSTYKQLYGPRGGLILLGRSFDESAPDGKRKLHEMVQKAVFPYFQGTPNISAIAAKARALAWTLTSNFAELMLNILTNSRIMAENFLALNYRVLTGGSDNHLLLIDLNDRGVSGFVAEKALEQCNIIVNKNKIPGDNRPPLITSGIRLGTNNLSLRGMGAKEMAICAGLIDETISCVKMLDEKNYLIDEVARERVRETVQDLCSHFPIPFYPSLYN